MNQSIEKMSPEQLADRLLSLLSGAYDPDWDMAPPLVSGGIEDVIIDGTFDLVSIARELLEYSDQLISD